LSRKPHGFDRLASTKALLKTPQTKREKQRKKQTRTIFRFSIETPNPRSNNGIYANQVKHRIQKMRGCTWFAADNYGPKATLPAGNNPWVIVQPLVAF
jgi:hypothetical protein